MIWGWFGDGSSPLAPPIPSVQRAHRATGKSQGDEADGEARAAPRQAKPSTRLAVRLRQRAAAEAAAPRPQVYVHQHAPSPWELQVRGGHLLGGWGGGVGLGVRGEEWVGGGVG